MNDTVELWLSIANQLMLAFALVFLIGMLIGIAIGRWKKSAKRAYPPLPNTPDPTPEEFTELLSFYEHAQTWPTRERK